jgi:hypothetical protein
MIISIIQVFGLKLKTGYNSVIYEIRANTLNKSRSKRYIYKNNRIEANFKIEWIMNIFLGIYKAQRSIMTYISSFRQMIFLHKRRIGIITLGTLRGAVL